MEELSIVSALPMYSNGRELLETFWLKFRAAEDCCGWPLAVSVIIFYMNSNGINRDFLICFKGLRDPGMLSKRASLSRTSEKCLGKFTKLDSQAPTAET